MDSYLEFLTPSAVATVRDFIVSHWEETVRSAPADDGTLLELPRPYTVPCRRGAFQELYYWDTYFTCLGLIESGRTDLAADNARSLLALLDRFGFVPNGNRTFYLTRSQPPYLAALVRRVAEASGDEGFLRAALPSLRREYDFWRTHRTTPTGLARYGHHATRDELLAFHAEIAPRTGLAADRESVLPQLSRLMAECESGWDFNPRFDKRTDEFCAVDLNCLLHGYERLFAAHPDVAGEEDWAARAEERAARLHEFCWDEERGGFFDFDFVNGRRSPVASCATFQALWAGVATPAQAEATVRQMLPRLEFAFGVAACEVRPDNRRWQWDYPNGWPPNQQTIVAGLARYGYTEEARRVARKYLATVCRSFQKTGDLWEKYNVEDGTPRAFAEPSYPNSGHYGEDGAEIATDKPPAMMGWTAGAFMSLLPWAEEGEPRTVFQP